MCRTFPDYFNSFIMETVISVQLLHTSRFDRLKENGAGMRFSLVLNLLMGLHTVHLKISLLLLSSKPLIIASSNLYFSTTPTTVPLLFRSFRSTTIWRVQLSPPDWASVGHMYIDVHVAVRLLPVAIYMTYLSEYTEWNKSLYLRFKNTIIILHY